MLLNELARLLKLRKNVRSYLFLQFLAVHLYRLHCELWWRHVVVNSGSNKQHGGPGANAAKLDRETEELHHDKISLDVGRLIQQGRQQKEMTQKDLATVSFFTAFFSDVWTVYE